MLNLIRNIRADRARNMAAQAVPLHLQDSLVYVRAHDYSAARECLRRALQCANRAGARRQAGKIMVAMCACRRASARA